MKCWSGVQLFLYLLFCYLNIIVIVKSEEGAYPPEKKVVRSTVEEYVEGKINEGFAKVSS